MKLLAVKGLVAVMVAVLIASCGPQGGDTRHLVPLSGSVKSALQKMGSSPEAGMVVRLFKEENQLEVWKETADGTYKRFRTYEICAWSGELGPKIKEGDRQSPEGFYSISPGLMNPKSSYYLAFNTGFPNKFDRAFGRTGSNLMVHGDCSSRGCYAMTDAQIEEIYALARESFSGGNKSFQLQLFPFRMTPENMASHSKSPHYAFWRNIKEGYDYFEMTRRPPEWDVCGRKYVFNLRPESGGVLDASASCPALKGDPALLTAYNAYKVNQEAALQDAMADVAALEARKAEQAAKAEAQKQAMAERTEAVNNAVGGFFSSVFGGGNKPQNVPAGPAPKPEPRLKRS